jgi:hypothetical protein
MKAHELRVDVTDDDIRFARRLWLAALDDPTASEQRTSGLRDDLRMLMHAQAQQIAEEFRRTQRAAHRAMADEMRSSRSRPAAATD